MRGAAQRVEREIEMRNRQAYNAAALSGAAFAGKLPRFERAFRKQVAVVRARSARPQPAAVLEANLRALAKAWGADIKG